MEALEFLFKVLLVALAVKFSLWLGDYHVKFLCLYGLSLIGMVLRNRASVNMLEQMVKLHNADADKKARVV